ncbi:DUF1934 domain-containing protein [Paenalkalicoccus suaedae]|uniref:DUF1934 domain-containing protein n=1 Tax=Paenalkalicoccus suaedae TaxID=2592382 RepID=A0A859FJB3_9BACI|nr:DUF1934 domain-containing protein [Paenalkalicoccus suaedae]QKS72806.1 DUF1934 domain-containing protein [Paenalkalicoccus suaedae]
MTGLPITIQVRTTIRDGKRSERHSMDAIGELFVKGEFLMLKFQEPREEQETESTNQTIQLRDGRMTVQRKGAVTMNQRFVEGTKTEGMYNSIYGPMHMETDTKKVSYNWNEDDQAGDITLTYDLVLSGSQTGRYHMKVTFKEETS